MHMYEEQQVLGCRYEYLQRLLQLMVSNELLSRHTQSSIMAAAGDLSEAVLYGCKNHECTCATVGQGIRCLSHWHM